MTYYRRRLPHCLPPSREIFITWRLLGSLPRQKPTPRPNSSAGATFVHFDRILDRARLGPLWLRDPRIAECVVEALNEAQHEQRCRLSAYVLMANHVHILWMPIEPLSKLVHQIKGATARRANLVLSRTGQRFWQDESFDHWVRNPAEQQKIKGYIENNPVTAGFVSRPEDWPWSSASHPIG